LANVTRYSLSQSTPFIRLSALLSTTIIYMPDQHLLKYIELQHKKGIPQDEIITLLLGKGWKAFDIEDAFRFFDARVSPQISSNPEPEGETIDFPSKHTSEIVPHNELEVLYESQHSSPFPDIRNPNLPIEKPPPHHTPPPPAPTLPQQSPEQPLEHKPQQSPTETPPPPPSRELKQPSPLTASEPPPPPQGSTAPSMPRSHSKKTSISIVVAVSIALFGGGAALYFGYFSNNSPNHLLLSMYDALQRVNSFSFDGTLAIDYTFQNSSPLDVLPLDNALQLKFDGDIDVTDLNKPTLQFSLDFESSSRGEGVNLLADIRYIHSALYLRAFLDDRILGAFATSTSETLRLLNNQWIAFTTGALYDQYVPNLSPELTNRNLVAEHLNAHPFIRATRLFSPEEINGAMSHHVGFMFDSKIFQDFLLSFENLTEEDRVETEDVVAYVETLDALHGELWIGKLDFLPRKVTFDIPLPVESLEFTPSSPAVTSSFLGTLFFNQYNQPVVVERPQTFFTFEQIFTQFFGGIGGFENSLPQSPDDRRLSDLQTIQSDLRNYYEHCGFYPGNADCGSSSYKPISGYNDLVAVLLTTSSLGIVNVPRDPSSRQSYLYAVSPDGQHYLLGAVLDDPLHPLLDSDLDDGLIPGGLESYTGDLVTCNDELGIYCLSD